MRSLRKRAIIGGLIWAAIIVFIGGIALYSFFDALTLQRFDSGLMERHRQLIVALSNSDGDPDLIDTFIPDATYQRPYSGRYWQVTDIDGQEYVSRSLFEATLEDSSDISDRPRIWAGQGPNGAVRGLHQNIVLEDGAEWTVRVAESVANLNAERLQIRKSLLATFALVGALGIAGSLILTSVIMRPLSTLRSDIKRMWEEKGALTPDQYPEEVAPLVADIDTLLSRNRDIVDRSRRQTADMAHALKTPTAILRNELAALSSQNIDVSQARDALDRVDAQLVRSLARIRAANTGEVAGNQTNVKNSVQRISRLFRNMPTTTHKTLTEDISDAVYVPMDAQDFEEILGNTIENAFNWAKSKIEIECTTSADATVITIHDDGPGIVEEKRSEALRSGGRLDTAKPGTGLGLAIVEDLIQAYGGSVTLGSSAILGGLSLRLEIPFRRGIGIVT